MNLWLKRQLILSRDPRESLPTIKTSDLYYALAFPSQSYSYRHDTLASFDSWFLIISAPLLTPLYDLDKSYLSYYECKAHKLAQSCCLPCRLNLDNWKPFSFWFFLKASLIWFFMPTHLPLFDAIGPRRLNRVSGRLKRIGEEKTGYHKPFSFDLKEVVYAKWNLWKPTA